MEFEAAAKRLAKDQSRARGRQRQGTSVISAKAKREAEYRKRQQEKLRQEREEKKQQLHYAKKYMASCERELGVSSLKEGNFENNGTDFSTSNNILLKPTSIHGDGDKIALPPSVLQFLTTTNDQSGGSSSPWTFRIGLLRPDYSFPSSASIKQLKPPSADEDEEDMMMIDDEEEEYGDNDEAAKTAYLDELSQKYISYTHGTVVEFTQEEGFVGIPKSIASALLDPKRHLKGDDVPVTRTVDPSGSESAAVATVDEDNNNINNNIIEEEKTPGHVAWGEFDVPDMNVEITFLQLPKGKNCTLVPSAEAIQNGFYNLKDIKLVLEQSLIRTRATLSIGDVVHSWHRGFKYDLIVKSVMPSSYGAVSCINTDIEVEFGENSESTTTNEGEGGDVQSSESQLMSEVSSQQRIGGGGGRMLSSPTTTTTTPNPDHTISNSGGGSSSSSSSTMVLPPKEPSEDVIDGVAKIQFKLPNGKRVVRRFYDTDYVQVIYDFVKYNDDNNNRNIELRYGYPPLHLASKVNCTIKECNLDGELIQGRYV